MKNGKCFLILKWGGKRTKVLNTSALVLNKKKNFALAKVQLKQHISFLLKINVVVLMASISATLFICYTVKAGKTNLAKNRIDFD